MNALIFFTLGVIYVIVSQTYKEAQVAREWASQCEVIHEAKQLKEELENARNSL